MPRYAPLPAVNIDPRNEAQLVNEAAKRAYDASNAKLNDFSAGNPLMALLEGQAFAQGEFLFWANQLPESILIEWIGPFLGAMRRLGTASTTRLLITVSPQPFQFSIPAGTEFTTNSNLTDGESIVFTTASELTFAAGETSGTVPANSVLVGTFTNVAANTVTQSASSEFPIVAVTNTVAAVGGSDVETLDQTKERFFTLIRRRNPVSSQDWQDVFEDLFGAGTFTAVLPNRSTKNSYVWLNDYIGANGHISFFFLNADGTEPTPEQVQRAQNVVDFSLPLEMQGNVYPIELNQVQYELDLEYDPTAQYAGYLKNFSLQVRDSLYSILTPGSVFPSGYDPTVSDIDSALLETFPADTKYSEPNILSATAYNTPVGASPASVEFSDVLDFKTQETVFSTNDLLTIGDPNSVQTDGAWPVIKPYSPYSSAKTSQVLYGNLRLEKILAWQPGLYEQGQVFRNPDVENSLLVVLRNFELTDPALSPALFIEDGALSAPKDFRQWTVGDTYFVNNENTGFYDPDVVAMDQEISPDPESPCVKRFYEPPGEGNLYYKVGWYCFVVNQDFTLPASTDTVIGAQNQGLVNNVAVAVPLLKSGGTYSEGTWIKTPAVGSGPNPEIDPYYFYVDKSKGVVVKYAHVEKSFTFLPSSGSTLNESFGKLISEGTLSPVKVADASLPQPVFQYKPRFPPQVYVSYKASASSEPQYYFTLTGFTPTSQDPAELEGKNYIARVDTDPVIRARFEEQITPDPRSGRSTICPPTAMFVFSPGDRTLFRQQNTVVSYVATQHFTPVFSPGVYIESGVLAPTDNLGGGAIPFYDLTDSRLTENIVISEDGKNLYRVIQYFTALSPVYNWDGSQVVDTARLEELSGNLLRVVNRYQCEEAIRSSSGPDTSGLKLGVAQINLRAKDSTLVKSTFVWENTNSSSESPALSYSSGGKEAFTPISYGIGTLAL